MEKLISLVLALALVLLCVGAAFADDAGTITIANASKGEKYSLFKIFDATVSDANTNAGESVSIAYTYTGDLPEKLATVFQKIEGTDYVQVITGKTADEVTKAVTEYAATLTSPTYGPTEATGGALTFNVAYGYYAIKSTQNADKEGGNAISVDSTHPNATVYDKNESEPDADKTSDKESYSIGDTITYTATFNTANYLGNGENAKQVTKYVISDTLPEFLSDVTVTGITVGGTAIATQQFDANKEITITWATEDADSNPKTYTSLYGNGDDIVITYTAKLTAKANIDTANTNTVTITPYVAKDDGSGDEPWNKTWTKDKVIKTYAAALKKTDGTNPLAGAQFTIKGLTVTGENGIYTVVTYNPAANAAESAVLDTDTNGKLYIVGLASDVSLTVTEYKAPDGYNKLTAPTTVTPQVIETKIYKEAGTIYYDAKGNVTSEETTSSETVTKNNLDILDENAVEVINNAGTELPSTGGIGTTIFYLIGGLLVVGAAVVLVARRKAD